MKRMKRHLPILFCFALLLFPALSLRALDVLPSAASLGRFPANQAQERVFTLRNPSAAAVVVDALRTSCGCLKADLSSRDIPARGQASLTVRLPAEGSSSRARSGSAGKSRKAKWKRMGKRRFIVSQVAQESV